MRPLDLVLDELEDAREYKDGYRARCPAHDDNVPSLSIKEGNDGKVMLKCFRGCDAQEITRAVGLTLRNLFPESPTGHRNGKTFGKVVETYDYHDAEGQLLFQTLRYEP